ncbi:MAG: putative porin [Nitrospirota bacterium]
MCTTRLMLRAAGAGLAAIICLAAQSLTAQTSSESKELDELRREIAELKKEVASLKKSSAPATGAIAEGKTKTLVTNDGKKYVEQLVPDLGGTKWKLFPAITELELFGDARLRYEYRGGRLPDHFQFGQDHANDWYERERERYRLRLGLRGTLLDDWFFGVRLETSTNPRSTNVTFGDDSNNGPFAKNSDGINVGQAYLGYKGFPDFTFWGGRFAPTFVNTGLLWDDDINVEGLAQQWKHTFTFGGGPPPPPFSKDSSKDGKAVVAVKPPEPFLKLDLFANFGQFVYDDANPENPIGPQPTTKQPITGETQKIPNHDAFLMEWQVGARFEFPHICYFQLAPTLYNYTGNGDTFNIHFSGDPGGNQTGINSLLVFDMPAEFGWKLWNIPMRVFGDFATNFEADDRAAAAGHAGGGGQRYAYEIGLGVGQLKKKHDWEIRGWWQHTEQFAVDPNLVDSDIFDSRVNMEGPAVKAGYMLADAIVFNLTYAYGWRVNGSYGTGGIGDLPINPVDQYQLFQADLSVKF